MGNFFYNTNDKAGRRETSIVLRRREKDIKTSVVGVHHGGEVLRISLSGPPIHFPIEFVDQTGYRQPLSFDKRREPAQFIFL